MTGIQNQRLAFPAEAHAHIHSLHGIHLHHILHSAGFLRQCDHGRDLLVFQLLDFDLDGILLENFLHQLCDFFRLLLHLFLGLLRRFGLEDIRQVRIDPLELDTLILHLQLRNKRLIDIMCQDHGIHLGSLEHIDILALLLLVRHIIDDLLLLLFFVLPGIFFRLILNDLSFYLLAVLINRSGLFPAVRSAFFRLAVVRVCSFGLRLPAVLIDYLGFHLLTALIDYLGFHLLAVLVNCILSLFCFIGIHLVDFQTLRQCQIDTVQVLEENVIRHLLAELVVFQAAKLDKRADIIPVFLIFFFLGLAHTGQLVSHFFRDIFADLLNKTVILQCASGHIQRQIRTVDHAF